MGGNNPYRTHSIIGSVGRPVAYHNAIDNNPSFSSASSYEYAPPAPMAPSVPPPTMMMMPSAQQVQPMSFMQQQPVQHMGVMQQQQPLQPMGVMQQQQQAVQQMGVMQQQQPLQPMGVMQQQQQPVQQQFMYRPLQMQSSMPQMAPQSVPPFQSSYFPQNYMYQTHPGMSFGYRPMMQHGRMIPSGMPMMATGNTLGAPANTFSNQSPMFNPMAQQLVY
jgi:hypothetical protein